MTQNPTGATKKTHAHISFFFTWLLRRLLRRLFALAFMKQKQKKERALHTYKHMQTYAHIHKFTNTHTAYSLPTPRCLPFARTKMNENFLHNEVRTDGAIKMEN